MKSHRLISVLALLVILSVTSIISNSYIARWAVKAWFEEQGSEVKVDDLTLSFWHSQIEIRGLNAQSSAKQQLKIDFLKLNWVWRDLWDKKLTIPGFQVNGLAVTVNAENGVPHFIGPININEFSEEKATLNQAQEELSQQEAEQDWVVEIGSGNIEQLEVCYKDSLLTYQSIGFPVIKNQDKLDSCVNWQKLTLDTRIAIDSELTIDGDIRVDELGITRGQAQQLFGLGVLKIGHIALSSQAVGIQTLSLQQVDILANESRDKVSNTGVFIDELLAKQLSWDGQISQIDFSDLLLNQIKLFQRAADKQIHPLLVVNSISIDKSQFKPDESYVSRVEVEQVKGLESLVNDSDKERYLTNLSRLQLEKIKLSNQWAKIQVLSIDGLDLDLVADDKGLNLINWFSPTANSGSQVATEEVSAKPFNIELTKLSVSGQSGLTLSEYSTGKPIIHQVSDIELGLDNFATQPASIKKSPIKLSLTVGDSGKVTSQGDLILGGDNIELTLAGELSNIDLINLTDYSARFAGYRIDSGNLNLGYEFKLANNQIEAKLISLLEKFDLADLQTHEKSELNDDLGIPLPLALNLLRDSDDNIELKIPLSGDLANPDFSVASIMSIVVAKAIKNAVIYHYSPLGMLTLASGVFDLATALKFEPLDFAFGSSELNDASRQQLAKLAGLMNEKPKVKFRVCAIATEGDWPALLSKREDEVKASESEDNKSQDNKVMIPVELEPLLALAKLRQQKSINYLVEAHQIERSRLFACNVKLSGKKKQAALVELSI